MATAERESPPIVLGDARQTARSRLFGDVSALNASRALWAVGLIYLIGSIADLVLAWVMNAEAGDPAWEFLTLANTLEGTPRIVLAVALIWAALYIRPSASMVVHRLLGFLLILLGVGGAIAGAMMVSDYFVLRDQVVPAEMRTFTGVVLKTLTLSALHLLVLVPVGVLNVRRPRG